MSKPDIEKVSLRMESIWMEAENRVIEDIVRRIRKEGKITSTADYQINRLIQMGKSSEEVEKILKEALDATYPQMFKLYDDIAEWEYVRNKDIYEQVNGHFVPPEDNEWLIQISEAVKEQTADELKNLSQSYGFSVMMGNRRVFMPFSTYYQKYVDAGIMDVISGNSDYNTVLRRIVTQMTNSGLRTVDYASGWSNRTPVAVRRAVMSGVSQITGKVNERNAALLETDMFEVSWHSGARPEHRVWQGRWYTYDKLISVCGLGSVTGLCGANCYHEYYPVIPGVSERQYSDEWLAEQNRKEEQTQEWHGKQLDAYGITQEQRKMETAMRAQRSRIAALKKGDYDPDQLTLEKAKYQGQLYEYTVFSNKMGVPQQRERIYMDGLGRLSPTFPIKIYAKPQESAIIKDKKMYRKKSENAIEPMPKKQLQKIVKSFKRQGGIIQMSQDTDAYLESKKAEAITYDAKTILLKRRPGRAAVYEELIHATQFHQGMNDGSIKSRLICEIEAQEKLLKNQRAYKLTDAEIKQTEKALKAYQAQLRELNERGE